MKGSVIRALGKHWNVIVTYFHAALTLAQSATNLHSEDIFPLVSFLSLWQSTISVKANVSVLDSKPFYSRMEALLPIMTPSLDPIIWREMINLFNEVLCYGSTLALQDFLPDEPCNLAHLVIRHVRVERLLDRAPLQSGQNSVSDRCLMQKLVLLVLKAVAVTVKETRSESSSLESESNSESGHPDPLRSEDSEDLHADMTVILRSIKQVFRIVDVRIKAWLPFHPEAALSEWMVKMFNDQDDALIETMLCSLDINNGLYSNCRGLNATSNSLQTGLMDLRGDSNYIYLILDCLLIHICLYLCRNSKSHLDVAQVLGNGCIRHGCSARSTSVERNLLSSLPVTPPQIHSKELGGFPFSSHSPAVRRCHDMFHPSTNGYSSISIQKSFPL